MLRTALKTAFWKSVRYGTRTNKDSWEKARPTQHFGKIPPEFLSWQWPQSSPYGKQAALSEATLPGQEVPEDPALSHAWRQQESAIGRGCGRRCHGQGSSRDFHRGECSCTIPGAMLLLPHISIRTGKLRFRDPLLFLNRYHRFLLSLDSWLALISVSFSKDNENSWIPNKEV